jgi:hypothetical protein
MVAMTRDEWIERFASELGVEPPDADTIETLLQLAGVAAHSSERTAAPIACWLAARAGTTPDAALATAESLRPPA